MTSGRQAGEEIEGTTISMGKRQEGHVTTLGANQMMLHGITDVTRKTVQRHDNTFTETGRTTGIVNRTDLVITTLVELDILRPITLGMFRFEELRNSFVVDHLRIQCQ